jgi:hypothetical protein
LIKGENDVCEARGENPSTTETDDKEWIDSYRLVHLATSIRVKEYGDLVGVLNNAVRHISEVFPSDDYVNRRV